MKKAIAITSAVFLISSVLTAVFAVFLGANGIRSLFDGKAEQLADKFDDLDDKTDDKIHSDFDFVDDLPLAFSKHAEARLSGDSVVLGFDAGQVDFVPTQDGKLSVDLSEYSEEGSGEHFELRQNADGYDFYIEQLGGGGRAKATVFVPSSVKNIKIVASAGEADIKDITADSLVVELDSGETELERVKLNDCKVTVDSGEINIDSVCEFKRLEANADTGKISYELAGGNIKVSYSVSLGSVSAEDGILGFAAYDENGNRTNTLAKSGRLESENADSQASEIILTLDTGSIEFENEIG